MDSVSYTHLVPDSQQDPADQPEPILQAAAIGILTVVPPEVQEAGEQIIVGTVDLDPIKARHLGRPGRMAELFHQPVQQLGREIAGGEGRPPVDAGARLPAAVADLGNEQGPVLVDPLGGQREEGGVRLLIQHRLPLICPLVPVHRQVCLLYTSTGRDRRKNEKTDLTLTQRKRVEWTQSKEGRLWNTPFRSWRNWPG